MFQIKPTINVIVLAKNLKSDNVPINVIVVVTTHNQVPKQHVLKEQKLVKAKVIADW
jgi:hypothetical protein